MLDCAGGMKRPKAILLALALGYGPMLAAERLPLEQDFRIQARRGITFLFFLSPDEGFYLTLRGSIATFRYLDGQGRWQSAETRGFGNVQLQRPPAHPPQSVPHARRQTESEPPRPLYADWTGIPIRRLRTR